jgi:hypothetical protein
MRRLLDAIAALILVSLGYGAGHAAPPGDARTKRAIEEIEKVGGIIEYDETHPGTPVVSVTF